MFHDYMFHVKHTIIDAYSGFKNAQIFLMRVFCYCTGDIRFFDTAISVKNKSGINGVV